MLRNVLNILTTFFYILTSFLAIAVPIDTNPKVISGEVEFSGLSTNEAIINQESLRAIVDYDQFNVLSGDMVRFIQPSEQAAILNRISGNVPSLINGLITANGQVFFVNPAGITFGENSVVRADLFLAAAGDISNEDFLNENLEFKLNGVIENLGLLQSNSGTYLLGKQILNSGKIESTKGVSLLASGDEIFLKNQGSSLMLRVSDNLLEPSENGIGVNNLGEVDGEEVMFSAGDAFADAIYHQGTARADKSVKLHSNGGNIKVSGEMEALSDDGGGISIFGDNISIENSTTRVISEALTGDDNLVQITAQDDLTLDGQGLALFGDTNLVISAKRFINNTGPNVFADGDADFRWSIALPKLIDESGPIHTFGGLKSNNPAKFGSVGDDSTPRNEYHFAFKPTITVTANNDSKIYGEFASELFEGVTFDESNLIDASFYGGVFSQDTIVTSVNQNGLALESDGGLTGADVGEYDISVSGIESPNGYDIRYVSGDLTVTPRAITLTASGQEKIYGDVLVLDDTAFSTTDLDGDSVLPNGELVDTVTLVSENEVNASTNSDAGTYAENISITPTATGAATLTGSNGFDQENYNISYATGDLTINRRAIELTASEQGKFYGDDLVLDDTAFSTTDLDGDSVLPNGELVDTVTLVSENGVDASTDSDAGTYADNVSITPTATGAATLTGSNGFDQENYNISYATGDLTVIPRWITLTASGQEKIYGDALTFDDTAFATLDMDGDSVLPNGELVDTVTLVSENEVDASTDSDAGTYADNISITPTATGAATLTGSNGFDQENYNISYETGDLRINRRAITLTASGQEKIYGDELILDDTAFSTTDLDGDSVLPNGELITNVSIQSATAKDASATADVATYENEIEILSPVVGTPGTGDGFLESNYDITYVPGGLTINRREITLTASGQEKIYGDELILDDTAFTTLDKDGDSVLPNEEVITNVSIQSATDKDASTTADVATYENEIEILSLVAGTPGSGDGFRESNYDITYVPGDLTINRRDSIVIIDDQKRFAGQYLKINQAAFILKEKLPNSESIEFINIGSLNGLANDPSSPRGYYPDEFVADKVIFGTNSFESSNYNLTFLAGDLEILPYPGLPAIFSEFDHPIWNSHHVGLFGLEQLDGPVPITDTILYRIDEVCDWGLIQDSKRNFIINEMGKANNRERTEELFKYHLNRE